MAHDMIYFIVPVEKLVLDLGAVHLNASLKHQLFKNYPS